MLIEVHILQNFAPSNLNRDDTGAPKDCEFGGYRRARISSQCLKRAMRKHFREIPLLSDQLGWRTKRLADEIVQKLEQKGKNPDESRAVVQTAMKGVGLSFGKEQRTQYLLFLGKTEIENLADACVRYWAELSAGAVAAQQDQAAKKAKGKKEEKKSGKEAIPAEVRNTFLQVLDGGKAADIGLFGRMLADLPDKNVDAACQVAHAISTHKVSVEFDYYTAIDDLKPDETPGADMIGTVEFNSACFYRYANVDLDQLVANLDDDEELARKTLEAFLRAAVEAIPTGKQNSMAAQNLPSLVMAVARNSGLCSLANAFVQPVRPDSEGDLVRNSITALDAFWGKLARMYGSAGVAGTWVATTENDVLEQFKDARVDNVEKLIQAAVKASRLEPAAREAQA